MKAVSFSLNDNKINISVFLICLFHFCGLIGIQTQYREWFLSYTPLNLILSTGLLLWNQENLNRKTIISFLFIFILGLTVEIIGVKTGQVFGYYKYGDTFGLKFMEVPFVIGINWAALCFASVMVINKYKMPIIQKALMCALLPVFIDFFIEQLCEKLNFWYWQDSNIPIQNFISWYVFSFLFSLILIPVTKNSVNKFAPYFLAVQLLFFVLLNIFYL